MQKLVRRLKRAMIIAGGMVTGRHCPACGVRSHLLAQRILWPGLISEWELSPEWVRHFDAREGRHCGFCRATLRDRQMAQGILEEVRSAASIEARSLRQLARDPRFQALQVAEINSAGMLHQFLEALPNVSYSQYGSTNPKVRSQDLMGLTYKDSTFDLVITSETLEHVPDINIALKEIRRVLKPAGVHVFSVPAVWDRKQTRRRASIQDGHLVHHLPPSYHGSPGKGAADLLVFNEFGRDFADLCRAAGFEVRLLTDRENPALVTFIARRSVERPLSSSGA